MWREFHFNFAKENVPPIFSLNAQEIINIPSTEAPVERVFEALSELYSAKMCHSGAENLQARLIFKFDTIFNKAGSVFINDLLDNPSKTLKLEKYPQEIKHQ